METISGQAEHWFARLRASDCSEADRRAFDAWLAADSRHTAAYDETQRMWSSMDELAHEDDIARWRNEAAHARQGPGMLHRRWGLVAAIAGLFLLVAGYAAKSYFGRSTTHRYATLQNIRNVTLPDGSTVTLNIETAIQVHIAPHSRTVLLGRGEAVFDVAHDAGRPFRVLAGRTTMTDLGTRFDVDLDGAQTVITVLQGAVGVKEGVRTAEITSGEQLAIGTGEWNERRVNPITIVGWIHGNLIFRATPLSEVVAEVNRYGPDHLVIADQSLERLKVSGEFRIGNTGALVRALESAFPIHATRDRATGEIRLQRQ